MNRDDAWVVLSRVVDRHGVPQRSVGIEEILGARSERDPFGRGRHGAHELSHCSPGFLDLD